MSGKYDWWKCARCGGRFLVTEPMHACYSGKTHPSPPHGARMSEIEPEVELSEAAKAVSEAVWQLVDVVSFPKMLPAAVQEAAKDELALALVRFAAAIRRG